MIRSTARKANRRAARKNKTRRNKNGINADRQRHARGDEAVDDTDEQRDDEKDNEEDRQQDKEAYNKYVYKKDIQDYFENWKNAAADNTEVLDRSERDAGSATIRYVSHIRI